MLHNQLRILLFKSVLWFEFFWMNSVLFSPHTIAGMKQRATAANESASAPIQSAGGSELLIRVVTSPDGSPRVEHLGSPQPPREEAPRPSYRLFQMGEVVDVTTLSRTTVWRLVKSGKLRTVDIGNGTRRVPEEELKRFLGV